MRSRFQSGRHTETSELMADQDRRRRLFFGSAQNGAVGAYSDLDIAVLAQGEQSWHEGQRGASGQGQTPWGFLSGTICPTRSASRMMLPLIRATARVYRPVSLLSRWATVS